MIITPYNLIRNLFRRRQATKYTPLYLVILNEARSFQRSMYFYGIGRERAFASFEEKACDNKSRTNTPILTIHIGFKWTTTGVVGEGIFNHLLA